MRHRKLRLRFLTGTALAAIAAILVVGVAAAATVVTVSGASPFASCTIGGPGTNYVNAEVEPWVAVNPANTQNVIGVWQQDRWNNGGAHGLVAGFSFDGGATWGETTLPFSACAGGLGYERASDPWVSIGPDGKAYAVSISFNASNNNNARRGSNVVGRRQELDEPERHHRRQRTELPVLQRQGVGDGEPDHGGRGLRRLGSAGVAEREP